MCEGELKWAASRLDKWLGRRGIEVTEADALALKWAEYANVERSFSPNDAIDVFINMEDYPQASPCPLPVSKPCQRTRSVPHVLPELFGSLFSSLSPLCNQSPRLFLPCPQNRLKTERLPFICFCCPHGVLRSRRTA